MPCAQVVAFDLNIPPTALRFKQKQQEGGAPGIYESHP